MKLVEIKNLLKDGNANPRDIKRKLARTFVSMYHDEKSAAES